MTDLLPHIIHRSSQHHPRSRAFQGHHHVHDGPSARMCAISFLSCSGTGMRFLFSMVTIFLGQGEAGSASQSWEWSEVGVYGCACGMCVCVWVCTSTCAHLISQSLKVLHIARGGRSVPLQSLHAAIEHTWHRRRRGCARQEVHGATVPAHTTAPPQRCACPTCHGSHDISCRLPRAGRVHDTCTLTAAGDCTMHRGV